MEHNIPKSALEVNRMGVFSVRGIHISELTVGTVQLGMPYGIANQSGMPAKLDSWHMLDLAVKSGVVSFDTASKYGTSEDVLGEFFDNRDKPTLITKFTLDNGLDVPQIVERIRQSLQSSLERLKVKQIPIFMLHHPRVLQYHPEVILKTLEQLKRGGEIGMAGISLSTDPVHDLTVYGNYIKDEIFEAVQVPINLLDLRLVEGDRIQYLKTNKKIVFGRSIFLQGALHLQAERLPAHLGIGAIYWEKLARLAAQTQCTIPQLAVSFVRDAGFVDSLVLGSETLEQLRHNIEMIQSTPLDEAWVRHISETFRDVPDQIRNPALWPK